MTKKDIVAEIARETGIKQIVVKEVVQKSLDYIIASIASGKTVELRNFGVFKRKLRKSRMGRNPKTGESVPVPARQVAVFKPGLIMKQKVGIGTEQS